MEYVVGKCGKETISAVMEFFAQNHDPSHVFAVSRRFVDWQYYIPDADEYNILIAKREHEILGLLAYIPNSFFDPAMPPERKFIWLANWLVKKECKGFVGLDLLYSLPKFESCDNLGVVGLTAEAGKFYHKTGYRVGKLAQYFFVNENVDSFKVIIGYKRKEQAVINRKRAKLKRISTCPLSYAEPYKSPVFFENKYMKNPFYKYFFYGITDVDDIKAVVICRVLNHNGTNVIRFVEYVGDAKYLARASFQDMLDEFNAEYMDFYCAGIPSDLLLDAGFILNTGSVIVPNYFEPFRNANVEIDFAYKIPECYIFKGDGDREHPRTESDRR